MKKTIIFFVLFSCTTFGFSQDSMNVSLLYQWNDPSITPAGWIGNTYNEVWGVAQGGREYAIIGSTRGTHIFDVTDPVNAYMVTTIIGADTGLLIIHRDFHDYAGYLYMVSDEGSSTLQIADLSYLPDSAPLVYDSNILFSHAHNIFIDTSAAKLYQCGGGGNQLSIFDISNPANPALLVNCGLTIPFWSQIGYIHDVYVRNDTAYLNAGNSGFFIVDFTNTLSPTLLASLTSYPQQGYNHSGWMHENANIYAMADETWGMDIKILDISDFGNISVIDTVDSEVNEALSIVHNPIFVGDYLYAAYYYDGLVIFDVSNPNNIFISGYYDTSTLPHQPGGYEGAWGVYPMLPSGVVIVSDMQEGMFVLDASGAVSVPEKNGSLKEHDMVTYPNPFVDRFMLSLPHYGGNPVTYELLDCTGKSVQTGTITNSLTTIGVNPELPEGIYLLKLNGEELPATIKVVKVTDRKF